MRRAIEHLADRLSDVIVRQGSKPYRPLYIVSAMIMGATLELLIIPTLITMLGKRIDAALGMGSIVSPIAVPYLVAASFLIGIPWLGWSILWQHRYGKGTPLPLVPTRVLLGTGPYRFTRNPMTFGAIFWLAGWAVFANSPTALYLGVGGFATTVLSYVKLIEEPELERRFGSEYRAYKQRTSFLVPWIAQHHG